MGCKEIENWKFEFVTKTQFLSYFCVRAQPLNHCDHPRGPSCKLQKHRAKGATQTENGGNLSNLFSFKAQSV